MKEQKTIFEKNKDVVTREIDGELFLIPLIRDRDEINALYTLNKMAIKIWDLIDGKKNMGKIYDIILDKYNVKLEKLKEHMETFIKDAREINIVKEVSKIPKNSKTEERKNRRTEKPRNERTKESKN